ncbi:hypothetical protein ACIQ2D_08775 [Lysinibacillus sp. NPDC097287]|uniref:hypothetical protein n=1 Tax=Lysinibacillus sp. NPDC097287 TaxID=3364144 RepID=UPI0037FCD6C0
MKKLLNQKEQHYADTREEAEEIVIAAKENEALIMNKISEKYNKYGQYFLVDLTYQYGTPKEVMEGKPDDAPDGQMSIEEVDAADEDLPEFEDPFAEKKDVPDEDLPY